jgi:heme/copper-type cytochrome/quinol oxidase subunit 2
MRKLLFPILVVVVVIGAGLFMSKSKQTEAPTDTNTQIAPVTESVKEFTMTAYYDPALKKPIFSLPEMSVKKGDKVKIKVTNTLGMHDFLIDEFKVAEELPLNQEVVIEFTADKAGDFVYYCSKPGHRQNGQWGTLKVTE